MNSVSLRRAALLASFVLALAHQARAQDAAAIVAKALEAARGIESYSCKFIAESALGASKMETEGTVRFLKPSRLKLESTIRAADGALTRTLMVSDGASSYVETRGEDGKPPYVIKSASAAEAQADAVAPSQAIEQFQRLYEFEIDPADGQSIEGKPMRTLKGKLRAGEIAKMAAERGIPSPPETAAMMEKMMARSRLWIGRDDHFLYRIETIPEEPAPGAAARGTYPRTTTTFRDVNFSPGLAPADFVYVPPEGAHIQDLGSAP